MARYNIYKIKDGSVNELIERLLERQYTTIETYNSNGYELTSYFKGPEDANMWWLEQYSQLFGRHVNIKNKIYSGAIVANRENTRNGYIIPLGKTHFYIQDLIVYNFGLELAEKIADQKQTKMKSLKSFGGKTSKALFSYTSGSELLFSSGESAEYLKLKASDKEFWGKSFLHFGTSVQLNSIDISPENLGVLLSHIDQSMAMRSNFSLPLIKEVKDQAQIDQLFQELANGILNLDEAVNILDYELYGVDFIFSQQTHIRLKFEQVATEPIENLSLTEIKNFINDNNIDLVISLREIKAQILVDEQSKFTTPLLKLIEYYSEDRKFLYQGKWYFFNDSFINALHSTINNIEVEQFQMSFSNDDFLTWQDQHSDGIRYCERYIIEKINDQLGFQILDRELDHYHLGKKRYKLEVSDLLDVDNSHFYVIKRGKPHDFGYAFDQAMAMLSSVTKNKYKTENRQEYDIERLNILLVFNTDRDLRSATDTKSIIFEIKLNELYRLAQEKNVKLKIFYTSIT